MNYAKEKPHGFDFPTVGQIARFFPIQFKPACIEGTKTCP
jgi:hypothetical protein